MRTDPEAAASARKVARGAFDEAYCDTRTLPQLDAINDA